MHPRQSLLTLALSATLGIWFSSGAIAQSAGASQTHQLSVPSQPLAAALEELSKQTNTKIALQVAELGPIQSKSVIGQKTAQQALAELLAGSSLAARSDGNGGYLVAQARPQEANTLSTVVVTGTADNGPSTEFTGSYTSSKVTIGRGEQSLREIPQSVSVVTRQRMDDQGLQTLGQAMQQTTGVIAVPYGNGVVDFTSRGYPIDQYQFDGLAATGGIGSNSSSSFDTAIFDRIEVLRGPAGLLQGAGEPSGTINMVRKRALKEFTLSGAVSAGSWNSYRGEVDITGPIAQDGALRGRFVAVKDDRDSYIDHTFAKKSVVYGTLEYDFTPNTTLSVGVTRQAGTSVPNFGLPNFADGTLINLPTSTFLGAAWNKQEETTTRYFADLEHRMDNGGLVRVAASTLERNVNQKTSAFGTTFPNPITGNMNFRQVRIDDTQRNNSLDAYVSTPFDLFGQKNNVVVGASRNTFSVRNASVRGPDIIGNIYSPNYNAPEPAWGPYSDFPIETEENAIYGQLRIKPSSATTFIVGGRSSWWKNRYIKNSAFDVDINGKFTPYVAAIYDVSSEYSLYASYANIYKPQLAQRSGGGFVEPRKGKQAEIGVKAEWLKGQLNGQLAVFQINDENRAVTDPLDPAFSVSSGKARSQGIEAEVSGQIMPRWDLMAGYTYTDTKLLSDPTSAGLPFSPDTPKHSLKIWSKHRFAEPMLQKFSFGWGVIYSSGVYAQDGNLKWSQDGYTVASALLEYKINSKVDLTLNINNIFDKKYYARVGGFARQSYYGDPRNVMLTLRARF